MSLPLLQVVIASTRPGRIGKPVAEWFASRAREHGGFEIELVDLLEVNLPMFDEPKHPRLGEYEHAHTIAWSAVVSRADAFVFVIPEYNYGFNAAVKNALDYLNKEWQYKPAGVVSYGGVAAGTRATQMLKQVLLALKMLPVNDAVNIPFVGQFLNADGAIEANDVMQTAADTMLDELQRVASHIAPLRS